MAARESGAVRGYEYRLEEKEVDREMRDKRLIARLKAGDRGALDLVIERYTPSISVIVYKILSSALPQEEIAETVADVFITLWENVDKLTGDNLKGYLAAVARACALGRLRRARPPFGELDGVSGTLPPPDAQIIESERAGMLREVVERMEMPDREILLRYYYKRQSVNTIADALSMPPWAVKARLLRGRNKLLADFSERGVTFEELL